MTVDVKNQRVAKPVEGTTVYLTPSNAAANGGSTKFRTYQRGSTPSMNYYMESNMSLQKFYSFFANGNGLK